MTYAIAEHIIDNLKSFCLFATHYFELTSLSQDFDGIANVHLDATEHRDGVVFLHAVKPGPASRSYGLAVAQLAGVPREVIAAAREYLAALERGRPAVNGLQAELPLEPPAAPPPDPRLLELRDALTGVNADELSPREALDLVYKLRRLLD